MPPNSEIEKLERRWRDNPKGTVFAPYAEVLRKNGDHALARDVLRQGLELHPDHIPGNIVLGRCCLDLGEDGPAEAAFAHVLDLDPENVIALKALADITERQGRLAEADNWLTRLVTVDPSNDEARDQITRVSTARESAAAVLSAEVTPKPESVAPTVEAAAPAPVPKTLEIPLSQLINPPPLEALPEELPDRSEASAGVIDDVSDVGAFADEALDKFLDAPAEVSEVPPEGRVISRNDSEVTAITSAFKLDPEPIAGLEATELDLSAGVPEVTPLADIKLDEEFAPPEPELEPMVDSAPPARSSAPYAIGVETASEIELRPTGASEFQSPDASNELLDINPGQSEFQVPDASADLSLSAGGTSEFQTPDASEELRFSGNASSEYQTPSGADELLAPKSSAEAEPENAPPVVESSWNDSEVSSTLATMAAMPTQELSTEPPAEPPTEAAGSSAPSWFFEEEEAAVESVAPEPASDLPLIVPDPEPEPSVASEEPESIETFESVSEPEPTESEPEPVTAEAAEPEPVNLPEPEAEPAVVAETEARSTAELRLIFPDDAAQPEPHRVRRITQAEIAPAEEVAESPLTDPEPVMTETMAELYARQGHTAEALRVYRALAEKAPGDSRLRDRIKELEARGAASSRRHTFVAVDTGGESVESFFRSLAEARPGSGGVIPSFDGPLGEDNSGAPTRPARDPLSLSAIFGEEPSRATAPTKDGAGAKGSNGPDAFSFDQFFGGSPAAGSSSTPSRPSGASEEDLDQFQNWLKSLKR